MQAIRALRFARNINLSIPGRFICTRAPVNVEKDYDELEKNHKELQEKYDHLANYYTITDKQFFNWAKITVATIFLGTVTTIGVMDYQTKKITSKIV